VRAGAPDAGGVSAGWSFEDAWLPSYPETSGYIVETFLAAAEVLERPALRERAARIVDWELAIQHADGSFPGHFAEPGSRPVVFNTGQIMHGMLAGYGELARDECLASAVRAGRWLVAQQDADGCWRRSVHNGVPHTYNTRAAWALVRTGLAAGEPALVQAARRNLEWALAQQTESGWFASNAFRADEAPFTHTIAYAARGFLEAGLLLGEARFVEAARHAAEALAQVQGADGRLAGAYADGWRPQANYCCLTGVAQMALIWQRLAATEGLSHLDAAATRAIGYLKRNQRLTGRGDPADGALAGSAPIWGRYSRFEFPNWAVKFFADSLMMKMAAVDVPQVHLSAHSVNRERVVV